MQLQKWSKHCLEENVELASELRIHVSSLWVHQRIAPKKLIIIFKNAKNQTNKKAKPK